MILAGANRHAKEVIQICNEANMDFILFDDYSKEIDPFFSKYEIFRSMNDIKTQTEFILALGNPNNRYLVSTKLKLFGLKLTSLISKSAIIGDENTYLGIGLNIMNFVFISNCVNIGEGTLINSYVSIHHDVSVGVYSELSPRATLLGGSAVGNFTSIGAGAIILPNISVGSNCIIGAGSVVTMDIPDNSKVIGIPGRIII